MTHPLVDRLMKVWDEPVPPGEAGDAAFATCYAAELTLNGVPIKRSELVAQARAMQVTYAESRREILDLVEAGDKLAVAFVLHVRQTGPLTTPFGVIEPTGGTASAQVIDIFTLRDGLIVELTAVADQLGLITQLRE